MSTVAGIIEDLKLHDKLRTALADETQRAIVMQADALTALRALPSESIDLFNFDLPYESLEKHRAVGSTTRLSHSTKSSNDWFGVFKNALFPELFAEVYRASSKNSHAYCYCDDETSDIMKVAASNAGFKVWKRIVFDKMCMGMGYHYRARYEFILFLEKGKRRLNDLGITDVLQFKRIKGKDAYPAEKPVGLNKVLIANSTRAGDIVCDPFMGSGSAGVAALELGRRFVGFDVAPAAVERTKRRLSGL
jgi:site-specific DNA-methyltransferase (adenine-specific)